MSFDKERIRAVKVERMSHRVMQHHAQPSEDNEECKAGEEERGANIEMSKCCHRNVSNSSSERSQQAGQG